MKVHRVTKPYQRAGRPDPFHDARWTDDRLQEAFIGLSAAPKENKVTLERIRGEVMRRQAAGTGGSDAQTLWEDHHPGIAWTNTAGEEDTANGLGPKQRGKVEKIAERSASGELDEDGVRGELQKIADSVAMGTSYSENDQARTPSSGVVNLESKVTDMQQLRHLHKEVLASGDFERAWGIATQMAQLKIQEDAAKTKWDKVLPNGTRIEFDRGDGRERGLVTDTRFVDGRLGKATVYRVQTEDGRTKLVMSTAVQTVFSGPREAQFSHDKNDDLDFAKPSSSVEKIRTVINKLFFSPERATRLVEVYATQAEAAEHYADQLSQAQGKVQAFVTPEGKVIMIAENVDDGHELAVFLHEVGVHVGMKKLIGEANYEWLTQRVEEWAQRNDGSVESRVAKQALTRAENSSSKDKRGEIIAYMVEGLVAAGVTPQAAGQTEGHRWFRRLWAAAKSALRHLGFKNPDKITGQSLVDLAYGAADLELRSQTDSANGATRFSQDENDDLDFTKPSSTIKRRERGTPTPKGIARAKKLYGGDEGYARYDKAAREFFDYVAPWVDRDALKGRTDVQALVQRLRVASDDRFQDLSNADDAQAGNPTHRSDSSIGGFRGYRTLLDDSEGSPTLVVVTDDQIARAKKEAAEYGLKVGDVLHVTKPYQRAGRPDSGLGKPCGTRARKAWTAKGVTKSSGYPNGMD